MSWPQFLQALQNEWVEMAAGVFWFLLLEYGARIPLLGQLGCTELFQRIDADPALKRLATAALIVVVPLIAYLLELATVTHGPVSWDPGVWGILFRGGQAFVAGMASFATATLVHTTVMPRAKPTPALPPLPPGDLNYAVGYTRRRER